MMFVYVHILVFALWMLFVEKRPWNTLTLIVSLEAIFLSTFVMIGQNRQAAFQQAKADHDFVAQEQELNTNTELTKKIHELTIELHEKMCLGVDRHSDNPAGAGLGQRDRRAAGHRTGHAGDLLQGAEGGTAVAVEGDHQVVRAGHGVGEGDAGEHDRGLGDLDRATDIGLDENIGPCHRQPPEANRRFRGGTTMDRASPGHRGPTNKSTWRLRQAVSMR